MIAVGIDPSLTSTGVAVINDDRVRLHTVKTGKVATLRGEAVRISRIVRNVLAQLPAFDVLVIEEPNATSQYGARGERYGLYWLILTQMLRQPGLLLKVAPPTRAAYAAADHKRGKGSPQKADVLIEARRRFPHLRIANDDEADALAMACMGARFLGSPVERVELGRRELAAYERWAVTNKEKK